jgi:hypothetical protein
VPAVLVRQGGSPLRTKRFSVHALAKELLILSPHDFNRGTPGDGPEGGIGGKSRLGRMDDD